VAPGAALARVVPKGGFTHDSKAGAREIRSLEHFRTDKATKMWLRYARGAAGGRGEVWPPGGRRVQGRAKAPGVNG
jgi:hypothetical protein